MSDQPIVCIDVGGSSLKSGVVEGPGKPSGSLVTTPIDSNADLMSILDTLIASINAVMPNPSLMRGLAFSFPGPFDYQLGIPRIQGLEKYNALYGLDIGQELRKRLNLPNLAIRYRNDAEAAVVGEGCYGASQTFHRVIGVTLGTGFGSAFIANGDVISEGPDVPPNGWLYSFPANGVRADDTFSTRGLQTRLDAAGLQGLTLTVAAQQARLGDRKCQAVFESFGSDLGHFLHPFALSFQADAILFLGGIASAFDCFELGLRQSLSQSLLIGELGAWAALLGASDLFLRDGL